MVTIGFCVDSGARVDYRDIYSTKRALDASYVYMCPKHLII